MNDYLAGMLTAGIAVSALLWTFVLNGMFGSREKSFSKH